MTVDAQDDKALRPRNRIHHLSEDKFSHTRKLTSKIEMTLFFVWRTEEEFSYEGSSLQITSQEADVSMRQKHTVSTLPW